MNLWLYVTKDEYELPIIVADSAGQLALRLGIPRNNIFTAINQARKKGYRCRYIKVEVDEINESVDA